MKTPKHTSRPSYTSSELRELQTATHALHEGINKDLNDGKLEMHKGVIVPKRYAGKRTNISVEFLYHEEDNINYRLIYFPDLGQPDGPLPLEQECAALFHYTLKVFRQWHKRTQQLSLESDHDEPIRYNNIFKQTARQYQVNPDAMPEFWEPVRQAMRLMYNKEIPEHIIRGDKTILHAYLQ